jgi:asparagine synthase (glutamine-hydrolysing)
MNPHTGIVCSAKWQVSAAAPSKVLAWNGRIDNRTDLCWQVRALPRDVEDDALALAVYERWGIAGLRRMIGDWSLIVRDGRTGDLVLASDYAGVRPLYYCYRAGTLFWASRLHPLVDAVGASRLDEQYVAGFLLFGGCPARTPYADVHSVPSGCAVRVNGAGCTTHPFWTPPLEDAIRCRDERAYDERMAALFREAVAVRLDRRGPVLAELSGGFDSSSVVSMAAHLIRSREVAADEVRTVSYDHTASLDSRFIDEVREFCGVEGVRVSTHRYPLLQEDQAGHAAPEGWAPVQAAVASVARKAGVRVILTGNNGDLANGNWLDDSLQVSDAVRELRLLDAWRDAFAWSERIGTPIIRVLTRAVWAALPARQAHGWLYAMDGVRGGGAASTMTETSIARAFGERTGARTPLGFFSTDWTSAPPARRKHFLALTMTRELRSLQPPEPLQEFEYTHPFAHRPLVEFAMTVPPAVLCRPGEPRRLMRRALAELWPPALRLRRSKSLFAVPWMEALRPLAVQLLESRQWHVVEHGWIDRESLTARLRQLSRGLECNLAQLRLVLVLEYWLRARERREDDAIGRRVA